MSELDQCAKERIDEFRRRLRQYKRDNLHSIRYLAEECELSKNIIPDFISGKGLSIESMYKIHLATGIAL